MKAHSAFSFSDSGQTEKRSRHFLGTGDGWGGFEVLGVLSFVLAEGLLGSP